MAKYFCGNHLGAAGRPSVEKSYSPGSWLFTPKIWCVNSFLCRVAQKREDAVSKEVTRKLSEADNRKMSRKEKDER